jgi:hypothetical protein
MKFKEFINEESNAETTAAKENKIKSIEYRLERTREEVKKIEDELIAAKKE